MDFILVVLNGVVAVLGVLIVAAGLKSDRVWKTLMLGLVGILLLFAAFFGLPASGLKLLKREMVALEVREQEDSDDSEYGDGSGGEDLENVAQAPDNQVVIVGDCDALVELLTTANLYSQEGAVSDDDSSWPEYELEAPVSVQPTPTQEPMEPAQAEPQLERSLPEEPQTGEPKCSSPRLLHGASGGPGEGGCHAVGCAEGYVIPMRLMPDRWVACSNPKRLARFNDCYFFYDSDESEQSARLVDGAWRTCDNN
jgi:hypothetical protein